MRIDRKFRAHFLFVATFAAAFGVPDLLMATAPASPHLDWIRQIGSAGSDESYDVSADGLGSVYIAGRTGNGVAGPTAGLSDAYLAKYDQSGNFQWARQVGSPMSDYGFTVATDKLGSVFLAGRTEGAVVPPFGGGGYDGFVAKYDSSGNQAWVRQVGTSGSEYFNDAATDGLGNVYLTGASSGNLGLSTDTGNALVMKLDANGNTLWSRRIGGVGYESHAISMDGLGNVYVSGETPYDSTGPNTAIDAFVSKLDGTGNLIWTRTISTSGSERAYGISTDGLGNAYVTGSTSGNLARPNVNTNDVFVSKYDPQGNKLWVKQFGTASQDEGIDISTDSLGNSYITGQSGGDLFGPNAELGGLRDVILFSLDASGNFLWGTEFGKPNGDYGQGVSTDGIGSVYVSGWTEGSLGGPSAGGIDGFVAKFTVPEPTTATLLLLGMLGCVCRRRR